MPWDDIFEPAFHKSWSEAIKKEKNIRLKWYIEYAQKKKVRSDFEGVEGELKTEPQCTCRRKDEAETLETKMDWPKRGCTGTNTLTRVINPIIEMKPPPPEVKTVLYEGISHDGKGRAGYLKRRWKQDPENRFYNRVCTSWDYGWNYSKENEFSCNSSKTCGIRERAFYRP